MVKITDQYPPLLARVGLTQYLEFSARRGRPPSSPGPEMKDPSAPVLTIDELSDYIRISKSTIYKLVRSGKIPGQKIGRHWRFRKAAIDEWLEESRKLRKEVE